MMNEQLHDILNTEIKVRILRLFALRDPGYQATGREIARQVGTTAPSAHAALKALYDQHIFLMEPIGRSHVYRLNRNNRMVQGVLLPAFDVEASFREDLAGFLTHSIKDSGISNKVRTMIFYGSRQSGRAGQASDVDTAVVVNSERDVQQVTDVFLDKIGPDFFDYFGLTLDVYIKSKNEFLKLLKKDQPPLSTLIQSYEVLYGPDIVKGQ